MSANRVKNFFEGQLFVRMTAGGLLTKSGLSRLSTDSTYSENLASPKDFLMVPVDD